MNARQRLVITGISCVGILTFAWLAWRSNSAVNGGPEDPAIRAVEAVGGECRRRAYHAEFNLYEGVVGNPVVEVDLSRSARGRVTDGTLAALGQLKEVRRVWFNNATGVTGVGLNNLAALPHLRELSLFGTQVTDADMKHFAALDSLRALDLGNTAVTDAGLKHLTTLTGLKRLELMGTRVTDGGLQTLTALDGLEELNLWGAPVTDAGLKHLARLGNLQSLNLNGTRVTDAGLKELMELGQLRYVSLFGPGVTLKGAKPLKQALWRCTVWLDTEMVQ